jgi:hypothetical protein
LLPVLEGWNSPVEDKSISLLPDEPSCNHKGFHEEFITELVLGLIHHGVEIQTKVPMDVEGVPTISTGRTREKEMEGGFLPIPWKKHTVVGVTFQFMILPSENVSYVEHVH